jgi:hypothetical protein
MLANHTQSSHVGCSYQPDQHNIYHIYVHIHPNMESKQEYITNIINISKHQRNQVLVRTAHLLPGFSLTLADETSAKLLDSCIQTSAVARRSQPHNPTRFGPKNRKKSEDLSGGE